MIHTTGDGTATEYAISRYALIVVATAAADVISKSQVHMCAIRSHVLTNYRGNFIQ